MTISCRLCNGKLFTEEGYELHARLNLKHRKRAEEQQAKARAAAAPAATTRSVSPTPAVATFATPTSIPLLIQKQTSPPAPLAGVSVSRRHLCIR